MISGESDLWKNKVAICTLCFLLIICSFSWAGDEQRELHSATAKNQTLPRNCRPPSSQELTASDGTQQSPENKLETETHCLRPLVALTDGADYAGVARRDWLLVDVQQTEVLQECVSHAGVQLLALDERVWQCHRL